MRLLGGSGRNTPEICEEPSGGEDDRGTEAEGHAARQPDYRGDLPPWTKRHLEVKVSDCSLRILEVIRRLLS